MSYILDALKKSETERLAGTQASFARASAYAVEPSRRPWHAGAPLLAGAGMLITGLVLGAWRPWQAMPAAAIGLAAALGPSAAPAPRPAPSAVLQEALPIATGAAVDTVAAASRPAVDKPVPVQASAVARPAAVPAEVSAAAKPAVVAAEAGAVVKAAAAPVRGSAAAKPATAPVQARAAAQAAASAQGGAALKPGADAITPTKPAAAAVGVAGAAVVSFQELPAEIRSRLPAVVFGGYAGVDEAEVRIAFINNVLVKEGEELSPGLKLEQVGREGVVLGYKGHHFRPGP